MSDLAMFVKRNRVIGFDGQKYLASHRPAPAVALPTIYVKKFLNVLFKWDQARAYQYFLLEFPAKIDFPTMLGRDYADIRALNGN